MKKKMRKFDNGGLSKAQEEYLGGADRTDPFIMARMRRAVPDEPKAEPKAAPKTDTSELRDETGAISKIRRNTETGDLYSTEAPTPKATPKAESKPAAKAEIKAPKREKVNPTYNAPPKMDAAERVKKEREKSAKKSSSRSESSGISDIVGAKKGGLMSSASKRADGCAMRGKTKGRMV